MKLHRHLALIEVNDPAIIAALEATDRWEHKVLRRISPTAVAVRKEKVDEVAATLRDMGYLPRVIER